MKVWFADTNKSEVRQVEIPDGNDSKDGGFSDSEGNRVYGNTHFYDRPMAARRVRENATARMEMVVRDVAEAMQRLDDANKRAGGAAAMFAKACQLEDYLKPEEGKQS